MTEEDEIRQVIIGLHSQDLFGDSSTPIRSARKQQRKRITGKEAPSIGRTQRKQHIFPPEPGAGSSRDASVTMEDDSTTNTNRTTPEQMTGHSQEIQSSQEDSSRTENKQEQRSATRAHKDIEQFVTQFVNETGEAFHSSTTTRMDKVARAKKDLVAYYIEQMKLRDRAQRNLRFAKQKSVRVPKGMRIRVTPECPANKDPKFCQDWAKALSEAEEILCRCLELHLEQLIIKIDKNICVKVNSTLEIVEPFVEGDPLVCIKETLTTDNEERGKINEAIKKRKRENNGKTAEDNSGPPNKKFKKNARKDD